MQPSLVQDVEARLASEREHHRAVVMRWFSGIIAVFSVIVVTMGGALVSAAVVGTLACLFAAATGAFVLAGRGRIGRAYLLLGGVFTVTLFEAHAVLRVSTLAPTYAALLVTLAATLFPRRQVAWIAAALAVAVLAMRVAAASAPESWFPVTIDALTVLGATGAILVVDRKRVDDDRALLDEALGQVRRVSAEAQASAAMAQQANELKSDFLARVSHELRTPINAILGYTELLEEEEAVALESRPDLERISAAGRALLSLIDTVLDLSRVEAGRVEVHVTEARLDDVVAPSVDTIRLLAARNGNRVDVEVGPDPVAVDVDLVRQVLLNLLSNAVRFTRDGVITVTGSVEREELTLAVEDTGIGIRAERLPHLFQPFVQAERDTAFKYGGTGLGLAICDRLVRTMGGRMEVESELGRGSRFVVRLPVRGPRP